MVQPVSFLLVDDEQYEVLDHRGAFTTMTRGGTKVWPVDQVTLLISDLDNTDPALIEIGLVRRGRQKPATGWHRLQYTRRRVIEPLPLDELWEAVPARFRLTVESRSSHGGVLTEKSAAAVVDAVARLRPGDGDELRRLVAQSRPIRPRLQGGSLQAAVQEADAVRLALDIARIPRSELRDTRPNGELSFLEQVEALRAPEDTTIAYDSMRFLDFERIDSPSGAVVFTSGTERLTVINVNRQPLESTTGADLIYINEPMGSFVLVQYKTMRREGDPSRLVYRPDGQLAKELDRMRKIKQGADDGTPASYRLNPAIGFIKLCKPVTRLDQTRELVSGMYLPVSYYDVLAVSPQVKGPKGGVQFAYETVGRHIGNDLFVPLVRGGWIGSRGLATKRLTKLVLAGLDASRSVTVAAASVSR
jgi:hypothetical protein